MKMIEDHTMVKGKKCIKFIPRTDEDNYINLEMLRNCWSELGRLGIGRQNVSLGRQCFSHGTVMHELIHALGFYHEQSRADRDYYIDVLWDNVKKGAENNFKKFALGTSIDHLDQPYDYDSVMHYGTDSFAQDPSKPTITTKIKLTNGVHIGQRDHLSVIDIKMIQKLYSCDKDAFTGRDPYGPCFDKLENCNLYGQHACNQLPKWAEENCAATCGICTPDCSDKRTDCKDYNKDQICFGDWKDWGEENCAKFCGLGDCQYITSPKPAASCVDKIDDCADYQGDFCNEYPTWSAEKCPRYCNLCPADQNLAARTTKALPTTTKPPPTTTPTPTTTDPDCFDADSDCVDYSKSVCKNYYDWAKAHCKKYCGLCGGECNDDLSDCDAYGDDVCTNYPDWAKINCRMFCKFCKPKSAPTTTTTTTTQSSICQDALSDCPDYTRSMCSTNPDWAKLNCANFCGFCGTQRDQCVDKRDDCYDFGEDQCGGIYSTYMKEQCANFCGYC
ncbi:zinc metalloproteinase nas-15-like [Watersipora subatra]|uniref:zinc metalloproteinase nas-15-like n=1 Tax=Watersipora subatra TaxID=2589382 RepID=UPI00355AF22D